MKKTLISLASGLTLLAASFALSVQPAFAAATTISLGASSGSRGGTVTITGSHFAHSTSITVTINGHTGDISSPAITSTNTGTISGSIVIPTDATIGTDTVTATDGTNSATASFTVNKLTPTLSVTNSPVTYTGSAQTATVTGSVAGTVSNIKYGGSSTAPTNVGTYAVTADFTPTDTTNYNSLSGASAGSFAINQASQTISFGALAGKTYGDANFTVSATATSGLTVTFTASGACTASSTTITLTGVGTCTVTAHQTGNTNYSAATDVPQSFTVAAKTLTVTGVTANNKTYNGTTAATLNTSSTTLVGIINSDSVSLFTASSTAAFADKNVGTGKAVTVSGLALSGTKAGNYTLTQPTATANITAKSITVTATGVNKVYDGTTTTTATLASTGVVGGDSVTFNGTAAFADKNVGTGKPVSITGINLTGTDAGNYSLSNTTAATTANITAVTLTAHFTADSKTYDSTTAATAHFGSLTGVLGSDVVSATNSSAAFADKNVGTGKTVTVSGVSLTGTDAGNYTVAATASASANITAKDLTVTATGINKAYDGTTTASVNFSTDAISGDVVNVSGTATFDGPNVGSHSVSVTGISLGGADAGNYNLLNTTATTTANITQNTATITLDSSLLSFNYDGAPHAAGITGTSPAGLGYEITYNGSTTRPVDSGSYTVVATITDPNYAGMDNQTLVINKAAATINVTPYTVAYDGSSHTASGTATGIFGEDLSASLDLSATTHINAGGYASDAWTFAASTNYNSANGTVSDTITQITPTLSVTNSPVTFNGSVQAATVTGSVPGTVSNVKYSGSSTAPSAAGTYAITADFAPTDSTNYASLSGASAGSFVISLITHTLTYTAGANGSIFGTSPQTVPDGSSGSAVTAVPNSGFHFVNWSDGSTANPRADTNVLASVSVTASFAANLTLSSVAVSTPSYNDVIVSWTTDQPATSRVVFDTVSHSSLGSAPNYGYASSTLENAALTTTHSVDVTNLNPATTYFFRPVSSVSSEVVGDEVTVTTTVIPPGTQNIASGSGGAGGNNSNGLSNATPTFSVSFPNGQVLGANTQTPFSGQGQVLGATTYNFQSNLKVGSRSTDVKLLQEFLNSKGFTVAKKGAGSPGNETNFFGGLTRVALMKYQKSVGLKVTGVLDAATRAYINGLSQ